MDDFQSVLNDSDGHKLLTVVASLLHEAADETFNNWARSLTESLLLVSSCGVWKIDTVVTLARDVILRNQKKRRGFALAVMQMKKIHSNTLGSGNKEFHITALMLLQRGKL